MKTIHDASFIFFSQVIIFLIINKPFSISINIEWFIVFNQSSFLEILLSINQAINISIKQDCRITKINSLVGERPAARGGTTRPDERKNLELGNVFLSLATRLWSEFAQGVLRHGKQICVPQITPCCYLTITRFQRLAVRFGTSSF